MKSKAPALRVFGLAAIAVVAAMVVFSSYTIIDPGHRGVVVNLGRVEETALNEGFHLIIPPIMRQVTQVDVRTKKLEIAAEAASSDLQLIQVQGILNYHLDPANVGRVYQEVGLNYESIIIGPALAEAIKAATAQYRVESILIRRAELRDRIKETLSERLSENYIIVDDFSLADVTFSEEFDQAIERKQVAEQTALQKEYELQAARKEVEIALARAEGEKQAAIIAAQGRAEARLIESEAEAQALALIAEQLRGNPDLIKYQWATQLSPTVSTVLLPANQDLILDAQALLPSSSAPAAETAATP